MPWKSSFLQGISLLQSGSGRWFPTGGSTSARSCSMLQVSSSHTLCQLQRHGKHHARDSFSASPALKHGRRWGARRLGVFTAANLRVSMSSTKAQASTKVPKHGATFEGQKMSWLGSASFAHTPYPARALEASAQTAGKLGPGAAGLQGKPRQQATGPGRWRLEPQSRTRPT